MNSKINKYKIDDYLYTLNVKEYRKAIHLMPELLDVSLNTFNNYRRIEINDPQDIPYKKVVILEQLFDLAPGTLTNDNVKVGKLKDLL